MTALPSALPEFTVTELSLALKRVVEMGFSQVRVTGEISGLKRHTSGHVYFALKDESSVLDGVCWRGTAETLNVTLQDGMQVIASGRLTTYPGRSKYQIVVTHVEAAGEGALLKVLEDRKRKLAAEGLFDESRKRPLPFLPRSIGIVTSPTGAVIRDILHRLQERFPLPVLLWPVAVQGEGAAAQVAAAIRGFNTMENPPDLLIVARGGGSLEDLWAFNEEIVVRAAASSMIPLISAIGHETDVTLLDFVADKRAPTPTAAAEFAVPPRAHLMQLVAQHSARATQRLQHMLALNASQLEALRRGLPPLQVWLEERGQRLDDQLERLTHAFSRTLERQRLATAHIGQLLESYSYTHTLKRGFAYVTTGDGTLISSKSQASPGKKIEVHFHDGAAAATFS